MVVWAKQEDVNAAVIEFGAAPLATVLAEKPLTHTPSEVVEHLLQTWQTPTAAPEVLEVPHKGFAASYPAPPLSKQVSAVVADPVHYGNPNINISIFQNRGKILIQQNGSSFIENSPYMSLLSHLV